MTSGDLFDLLLRALPLVQAELATSRTVAAELVMWTVRAADTLSDRNEVEARELLQAAVLWIGSKTEDAQEWHADVGQRQGEDQTALAQRLLRQAASNIDAARTLVTQDCVKGNLRGKSEDLRFTADAIGGHHAKA